MVELIDGHHFIDYQDDGFEHVVKVMTEFLLAHL